MISFTVWEIHTLVFQSSFRTMFDEESICIRSLKVLRIWVWGPMSVPMIPSMSLWSQNNFHNCLKTSLMFALPSFQRSCGVWWQGWQNVCLHVEIFRSYTINLSRYNPHKQNILEVPHNLQSIQGNLKLVWNYWFFLTTNAISAFSVHLHKVFKVVNSIPIVLPFFEAYSSSTARRVDGKTEMSDYVWHKPTRPEPLCERSRRSFRKVERGLLKLSFTQI